MKHSSQHITGGGLKLSNFINTVSLDSMSDVCMIDENDNEVVVSSSEIQLDNKKAKGRLLQQHTKHTPGKVNDNQTFKINQLSPFNKSLKQNPKRTGAYKQQSNNF